MTAADQRKLRDEIATNATMRIVTGVIAGESPEQSDAVLIAALDRYAAAVAQPLIEALRECVAEIERLVDGMNAEVYPAVIQARAVLAAHSEGK